MNHVTVLEQLTFYEFFGFGAASYHLAVLFISSSKERECYVLDDGFQVVFIFTSVSSFYMLGESDN